MKTTEAFNPDHQSELSQDIYEKEIYTNNQLVLPALLPFISEQMKRQYL